MRISVMSDTCQIMELQQNKKNVMVAFFKKSKKIRGSFPLQSRFALPPFPFQSWLSPPSFPLQSWLSLPPFPLHSRFARFLFRHYLQAVQVCTGLYRGLA